jgi:hypothetical protein
VNSVVQEFYVYEEIEKRKFDGRKHLQKISLSGRLLYQLSYTVRKFFAIFSSIKGIQYWTSLPTTNDQQRGSKNLLASNLIEENLDKGKIQ